MNVYDPNPGTVITTTALVSPFTNHTESAHRSLNILVVDDDAAVRRILSCILLDADYRVTCTDDGEEGWAAFCSGNYDGMITDNDMPRLSGVNLLRRVRAAASNLPIILISGQTLDEETDLAALLNPGMTLGKPFTRDELLANVNRIFVRNALQNQ